MQINDLIVLADNAAASKFFGVTREQALTLMAIAQAEGTHPACALRDYHVINGRPALKADAMLSRFQSAGGKVEWHTLTDSLAKATFSHASGGSVTLDWDIKRSQTAGLGGNGMWKKYPRQMLRARLISEGVRTVLPGVICGFYAPEELPETTALQVREESPAAVVVVEEEKPAPVAPPPDAAPDPTPEGEVDFAPTRFSLEGANAVLVWLAAHEPAVNAFLVSKKWIQEGETFRNLPADKLTTIEAKADAFADAAGIPDRFKR